MASSKLQNILRDIRFWIVLLLLIRLVGITNAPLETGHNWRQCFTNMIARNMLEGEANLLYPKADMAGEKTGIVASEFPFFNYLIYLFSTLFGHNHWYGRLINLAVSSLGLWYFYKLARSILNTKVAFNATIVLGVSIWFAFSRKIMPDTFSVSLTIMGLYHGYHYLKESKPIRLLWFFVLCTLGMLCKIPALSLFSVLASLPFAKGISISKKASLLGTGALAFTLVSLWYFYWVPHLLATYQYPLFWPRSFTQGFHEITALLPELMEKFYFSSLHSYLALAACLAGIYILVKSSHQLLKWGLLLISLVFAAFIIKTGEIFPLHNYYIIPFTPVMALLAGLTLSKLPPRWGAIALSLIALEGMVNQQHDFFIKENQLYKLTLEEKLNVHAPKEGLIVINGGQSPQSMYFAHRKGWSITNEEIVKANILDSLKQLGAVYLVVDHSSGYPPTLSYPAIYEDEHYYFYPLGNN